MDTVFCCWNFLFGVSRIARMEVAVGSGLRAFLERFGGDRYRREATRCDVGSGEFSLAGCFESL